MGRALKREAELVLIAHAFARGQADREDLKQAALRYSAAVIHNRKARKNWESKHGKG